MAWAVPSRSGLCLVALSLLARPTGAEPIVPPGFGVHVYVTGDGFEASPGGGARGVRSTSTLAFDETGALYLARTGRRYAGGEGEELWPLYRIPRGGARLTPPREAPSTRATSPSSARGSWRRATAVSCGSGATGRRRRRGSGVLARS